MKEKYYGINLDDINLSLLIGSSVGFVLGIISANVARVAITYGVITAAEVGFGVTIESLTATRIGIGVAAVISLIVGIVYVSWTRKTALKNT